ncbi:MAG: VTC domain-containing protein [Dehalococcoidia bacterium]|jgi:hypothetical protein
MFRKKKIKTEPGDTRRFERKFAILPRDIGLAMAFLRQVCRPDGVYPHNKVNSLYYDSAELDEYIKSASGEYRKKKVRIRWYDDIDPARETTSVYLELKSREGFASSKQREKFTVITEILLPENISKGIIDKTTLNNTLARFGHFPESPLRPVIVISYRRHRFREIQTGIRVSFDYDISATMVAPELGRRESRINLPGAVIEVKGPRLELPVTLRRMNFLDTDWSRFSKYGYCIDAFLSDPGTAGRFSPSGRMISL